MLKKTVFATICTLTTLFTYAQAYEGKVKYGKTEEPAIVIVYDFPAEVVDNALVAKLADKRLKSNRSKGFRVYSASVIDEVSSSPLDYSFKLDENGKKGSEKTTVYMVMQGSGAVNDAANLADRGKTFLEGMLTDVKRSNTTMLIKKNEEILTKEEKELKDLKKDQKSLEDKLASNKKKQETQEKIIASQKSILEDLKSKTD